MSAPVSFMAQLDECARELIHIPPSIQPHGMLFALTQADLLLAALSENAAAVFRSTPEAMIGVTIRQILDDPGADRLGELLRGDCGADPVAVRLRHPAPSVEWQALVHQSGRLTLVELEPCCANGANDLLFNRV